MPDYHEHTPIMYSNWASQERAMALAAVAASVLYYGCDQLSQSGDQKSHEKVLAREIVDVRYAFAQYRSAIAGVLMSPELYLDELDRTARSANSMYWSIQPELTQEQKLDKDNLLEFLNNEAMDAVRSIKPQTHNTQELLSSIDGRNTSLHAQIGYWLGENDAGSTSDVRAAILRYKAALQECNNHPSQQGADMLDDASLAANSKYFLKHSDLNPDQDCDMGALVAALNGDAMKSIENVRPFTTDTQGDINRICRRNMLWITQQLHGDEGMRRDLTSLSIQESDSDKPTVTQEVKAKFNPQPEAK